MIGYGIACVIVCLLSAFDRRAMPFGLTILCGWLVGFMSSWADSQDAMLRAWVLISLVSSLILFSLYRLDQQKRWLMVAAIAGAMLMLDVVYLELRRRGIPAEVQYSKALDAGLTAQLLLIGYRGAWNAISLFRNRMRRHLHRGRVAAEPSAAREKAAAE